MWISDEIYSIMDKMCLSNTRETAQKLLNLIISKISIIVEKHRGNNDKIKASLVRLNTNYNIAVDKYSNKGEYNIFKKDIIKSLLKRYDKEAYEYTFPEEEK